MMYYDAIWLPQSAFLNGSHMTPNESHLPRNMRLKICLAQRRSCVASLWLRGNTSITTFQGTFQSSSITVKKVYIHFINCKLQKYHLQSHFQRSFFEDLRFSICSFHKLPRLSFEARLFWAVAAPGIRCATLRWQMIGPGLG